MPLSANTSFTAGVDTVLKDVVKGTAISLPTDDQITLTLGASIPASLLYAQQSITGYIVELTDYVLSELNRLSRDEYPDASMFVSIDEAGVKYDAGDNNRIVIVIGKNIHENGESHQIDKIVKVLTAALLQDGK